MKNLILAAVVGIAAALAVLAAGGDSNTKFNSEKDLLSLHYDHAPDKDDRHIAAADRTILESIYGRDWIKRHVVAVSGAYGKNAKEFNTKSDVVMDAVWKDCGGWLSGHNNRQQVVSALAKRWTKVLKTGGDVWVKEGGQSDITAAVVSRIREESTDLDTETRINVIQHSEWNENQTSDVALEYTKKQTQYVKIRDANAFLNILGGNAAFERAALAHPVFGHAWSSAFAYYDPKNRIDFSDTGELMHILGLGEISINDFRERFLDADNRDAPYKPDSGDGKLTKTLDSVKVNLSQRH